MHRFYMFHSFTKFNRNVMSPACLFLAAKVEEQPRKLEHVIKTAHSCLREGSLDTKSETYLEYAQELIINENILLQTLGFEVRVDHPHTTVVTTCQLVRASKDLAQTSYFLATNSLHLTTMCLQQKPNVVACVCIHLACKWSGYESCNFQIPSSHEGKLWFNYVDKNITIDLLEELTQDFLNILDKCPSRLKKKIMTWRSGKNGDESMKGDAGQSTSKGSDSSSTKPKLDSSHSRNIFEDSSAIISDVKLNSERSQHPTNTASSSGSTRSTDSKSHSSQPPLNIKDYKQHKEYKERKEKERMTGHSSHGSIKPHGNGDVKRSHHQGRVDPERKATQLAFDSLHHMSREDAKRHEAKREHCSPLKMTIKPDRPRSHELSSKAVKRSHQSDNELSDGSERHSKHRRSETHPISNDNFPAGTINHTDLFTGQNYPPSSNKVETGNGSSGSDRHSKNRTAYSEGGNNSDRAIWNSGKSSTKSPGSSSVKSSNSLRKDRSIFSPPQHLSHHPPPPPHMLQNKLGLNQSGPPNPQHVLSKGNMNASFDQSYQRSHQPNYGHAQYPNPNMMGNSYQDSQLSAVQGMNSNGGSIPGSNQQEVIGGLQSQLQNIIEQQKYQIAQQQAQSQQSSIFDIDLLDSDLGTMPPLPPPLPQNNAPQPPPPPY